MRTIDLLTSCDDNLAELLLPQIASISKTLCKYNINLHLAHSRVSAEHIKLIEAYSDSVGVHFFEHKIVDNSKFEILAAGGGSWCAEAYYSFDAHRYLDCDRVMYFDASDVIFAGDIARLYFEDFGDNLILAKEATYFVENDNILHFNKNLLLDMDNAKRVLRGVINSGSYVMDLSRMREIGLSLDNYILAKDNFSRLFGKTEELYFGDQGLLSLTLLGRIKFPTLEYIQNIYYMPYNFCLWYFVEYETLWYDPAVVHFVGGKGKPWKSNFSRDEIIKIIENAEEKDPPALNKYEQDFYDLYFRYAKLTPIYESIKNLAINNTI